MAYTPGISSLLYLSWTINYSGSVDVSWIGSFRRFMNTVILQEKNAHKIKDPRYSDNPLDCWPTGRVIDPAPGAWFITKFISLA